MVKKGAKIGVNNISSRISETLKNGTVLFVTGLVIGVMAIYIACSLISFFISDGADQSLTQIDVTAEMVESPVAADEVVENSAGLGGAIVADYLVNRCFGWSAVLIVPFLVMLSLRLMGIARPRLAKWFICTVFGIVWGSLFFTFALGGIMDGVFASPGGLHGRFVVDWLLHNIGGVGVSLLLIVTLLLFMIYLTRKTIDWIKGLFALGWMRKGAATGDAESQNADAVGDEEQAPAVVSDEFVVDMPDEEPRDDDEDKNLSDDAEEGTSGLEIELSLDDNGADVEKENISADNLEMDVQQAEGDTDMGGDMLRPINPRDELSYYKPPTVDLLKKYNNTAHSIDMNEQNANKNKIVEVLKNFDIEISSIKATVGPTITLYEITPAPGVRIAKIRNLEDDIAMSLSALCIRIIAPIPEKGTIGIEVPNANKQIVPMSSLLNSRKFKETDMALPLAIGKTISNEVYMVDLAKMPHLLVAGATGMGKSVGLNAIITSLLYKMHPAYLKFVMVDPKMVELSLYNVIEKHFLAKLDGETEPIITDVTKVVRTLKSLCTEMDNRYRLLQDAKVRSVKEYNEKYLNKKLLPTKGHRFMPYIVVIIDEYGDLMMTAGKEVEMPIARIAQKARAVGMHMIIATQRPTTNIITGTIKANFPARMAFRVISPIDSRTILERTGANQLQGRGDMLMLAGNDPVRVQCALIETEEVEEICKHIAKQQGYQSAYILPEPDETAGDAGMTPAGRNGDISSVGKLDELFVEAARAVVLHRQGSVSLLQRKFTIGFNRAGRIMDQLCRMGIVGEQDGAKPRQVLCQDEADLEFRLKSILSDNN